MNKIITFEVESDELMEILNLESSNDPNKYVSDMINSMLKRFLKQRMQHQMKETMNKLPEADQIELYALIKEKHKKLKNKK